MTVQAELTHMTVSDFYQCTIVGVISTGILQLHVLRNAGCRRFDLSIRRHLRQYQTLMLGMMIRLVADVWEFAISAQAISDQLRELLTIFVGEWQFCKLVQAEWPTLLQKESDDWVGLKPNNSAVIYLQRLHRMFCHAESLA